MNYTTVSSNKNTNLATSTTVSSPKKDMALPVVEPNVNSADKNAEGARMNMLDVKLLEELENLNLSKNNTQVVPLLQPPPSSVKLKKVNELTPKNTNVVIAATLPKVQKNETVPNINDFRNNYDTFKKCMDTSSVVNKIWFETTVRQNITATAAVSNSDFGTFRCNQPTTALYQRPDALYGHTSVTQPIYRNGDGGALLYGNAQSCSDNYAPGSSFNLYSSQTAVYGSTNGRQYSEVAESMYSEIPDYFYSRVPDEILKPHRPAPPSPLVLLGPPQSMQQIQRKIQQGQVRFC